MHPQGLILEILPPPPWVRRSKSSNHGLNVHGGKVIHTVLFLPPCLWKMYLPLQVWES